MEGTAARVGEGAGEARAEGGWAVGGEMVREAVEVEGAVVAAAAAATAVEVAGWVA